MRSTQLMSRAAIGALIAAAMGGVCVASTGAVDPAPGFDASRVVTDENGVQAAPSGHVDVEVMLDRAFAGRGRASRARLRLAQVSAPRTARLLAPQHFSLKAPDAAPAIEPQAYDEDEAPPARVEETGPAPEVRFTQIEQPRLLLSDVRGGEAAAWPAPEQDDVQDTDDTQAQGDADEADDDAGDAARSAVADASPAGPSEEAAVYGRHSYARSGPPAELVRAREDADAPNPHVAFPRRAAEAAAAFDRYMHAASAIGPDFRSGAGVAAALKTASSYDPAQLEEGMVAYGAMAALQSPRFVYGVIDAALDSGERQSLIEALRSDPEMAADLPGAWEAGSMAASAIMREARPALTSGRALKQASYDVQHQEWSTAKVQDQAGRLAQAKALSAFRRGAADEEMARLLVQVSTVRGAEDLSGRRMSPVAAHSLAMAALAILDGASAREGRTALEVASEKGSADCLRLAKLNLFQCLSVAGPEYEDVYCLGQHAVLDTAQCVASAAQPASAYAYRDFGGRLSRRDDLR
jgi:hypothetical protein